MSTTALILRGQKFADLAMQALTPEQIAFAEWLAFPTSTRVPKTQQEWAKENHIGDPATLSDWKKIPELWEIRDSFITTQAKELIPEAIAIIKKQMQSENSKVALEAAKDILDRWAEPRKHAYVIASLRDIYDRYKPSDGVTTTG